MNEFEIAIKEHLDKVALSDPAFAAKYTLRCNSEEESIQKCCGYIVSEVQKLNRTVMTDAEVFGLAMHYYDENLSYESEIPRCKVVVSKESLTDSEKERIKIAAHEEIVREAIEEEKRKIKEQKRKADELAKKKIAEAEKKRQEKIEKKKEEFAECGLLFGFDEEYL